MQTKPLRVHNSGESSFTLKLKGSGSTGNDAIPVLAKSSVDANLFDNLDVVITQAKDTAVSGMYEYIDPPNPLRGGHVKAPANAEVTITQGMAQEYYRILNASKGKNEGENNYNLIVKVNGEERATIKPKFSADIVARNGKTVVTSSKPIRAIYEVLDRRGTARSGRFKITTDTETAVPIINLTDDGDAEAWYRMFNSGENPIKVVQLVNNAETDMFTLEVDQSIDFQVVSTTIKVKASGANKPIEGIYDLIRK